MKCIKQGWGAGAGAGAGQSRVFWAPWSRSRLKKNEEPNFFSLFAILYVLSQLGKTLVTPSLSIGSEVIFK